MLYQYLFPFCVWYPFYPRPLLPHHAIEVLSCFINDIFPSFLLFLFFPPFLSSTVYFTPSLALAQSVRVSQNTPEDTILGTLEYLQSSEIL